MITSLLILISAHAESFLLGRWVSWVVGGFNLPLSELILTQLELISAQLLNWLSLWPLNSAFFVSIFSISASPSALLTTSSVWDDTQTIVTSLSYFKFLSQWLSYLGEGFGGGRYHLSHNLGWSLTGDIYTNSCFFTHFATMGIFAWTICQICANQISPPPGLN